MNWWKSFYDSMYADLLLRAPQAGELEFLTGVLDVAPGARLFDQCCGVGRLSGPLSELGFAMVGVDLCQPYIQEAERRYAKASFQHGDAGLFVADPLCDGGFNSCSSFGYEVCDHQNLALLVRAFESLRPGSRFVIDTVNAARVIRTFQPVLEQSFEQGISLRRESRIDWDKGMLEQVWTYHNSETEEVLNQRRGDTRLYLPRELGDLLREAGFEPLQLYGNFGKDDFHSESERLIWVAQR